MELDVALDYIRSRHNGVLVTMRRDGRPQLSNITFAVGNDEVIRISVTDTRAKTKNMLRNSAISLHVTAEDFWSYVVLEGHADLSATAAAPDDAAADELVLLYRAVAGEHPDWHEYRTAMVADQRRVVRLRPTHAYGMLPVG